MPLLKCKTKDLSDVDNYRAIAISNSIYKLFESVILNEITTEAEGDELQFGFKSEMSTGTCTNVLKTTTIDYYTSRGSHVFAALLITAKLWIVLITGSCLVNF